ncbi:MAG TPA: hypothetical protein VLH16_00375, partial [Bacteroidales bacterium]|nr:hypothetical protein [Bacteroidales bacterium]
MKKSKLALIAYPPTEIGRMRAAVRDQFINRSKNIDTGEIKQISPADLSLLFNIYDSTFFNSYFQNGFTGVLTFALSTRMTRNAGKISYSRPDHKEEPQQENYKITMGIDFFFQYYQLNRDKIVNGVKTGDALEAFQLVFEHELCHLLELHCFKRTSCRQKRFGTLAANIFGHIKSYHQLPTNQEIASVNYGFQIGDKVRFVYDLKEYTGVITRITKRATVMAPDK